MNHKFNDSITTPGTCTICKYPDVAHSDAAECEAGNCKSGPTTVEIRYGNMLMCDTCWKREQEITAIQMSPATLKKNLDAYLAQTRAQDEKVKISADIHNAKTEAAVAIKNAIFADTTLDETQKGQLYARTLFDRFITTREAAFNLRKVAVEAMEAVNVKENEMRMWQVQVRTVASQLSADLQEQFKASNVTYNPTPVKIVKPAAAPKVPKKKYSSEELIAACDKYKVPMAAVQLFVTKHGMTPEDAAMHLRRTFDKGKA